jgi:hypothetical protein
LSNGIVSTIAGTSSCATGASTGTATAIALFTPGQIFIHSSTGAIYFAEYTVSRVRKVLKGIITTFAGSGTNSAANTITEGASATSMDFNLVNAVFGDTAGNVYIAYQYILLVYYV